MEIDRGIITTDILLRLGFKEVDTNDDGGDHFYYHSESDLGLDRNLQPYGEWAVNHDIEYVHQLQILFFAHTGKKLMFNDYEN